MHPKIDSVTVTTMFTCSICDKVKTGRVWRVLNAKPEFPVGAEPVDLLFCGECGSTFERPDDSEEQYQDFQKREAQARAEERTRFLKRLIIDPLQFRG